LHRARDCVRGAEPVFPLDLDPKRSEPFLPLPSLVDQEFGLVVRGLGGAII